MNRFLKSFLILSLACSSVFATTHSRKTFLQPRATMYNLPMELTSFHDHIFNTKTTLSKKNAERWNGHLQSTFFYQASVKGEDVGKYFGIGNGKNNFHIGRGLPQDLTTEVVNERLIHDFDQDDDTIPSGDFYLDPKQESFGFRFDYFQFLKHPFSKTFIKASMPIVRVENDPHFKIANNVTETFNNEVIDLNDFFTGKVVKGQDAHNLQEKLTHAKLGGARSAAGVADIDVAFGYRFFEDAKKHLYVNLGCTLPTGNKAKGAYLFEPVYGNGQHFAFGFGIDGSVRLWNKEKHSARLVFALNHRYLFSGSQKRTIRLNSLTSKFNQYYLLGKVDSVGGKNLIPAANVLTQDVSVRPGNMVDSMLMFSFKSKRFIIDLGYNLFFKEGEAVKLKNKWNDRDDSGDRYGIAKLDFDTATAFALANAEGNHLIKTSDFDLVAAATPSQLTHKIFGGAGFKYHIGRFPSSFSLGASYEFADNNHELEGYAFWGKLGLSF